MAGLARDVVELAAIARGRGRDEIARVTAIAVGGDAIVHVVAEGLVGRAPGAVGVLRPRVEPIGHQDEILRVGRRSAGGRRVGLRVQHMMHAASGSAKSLANFGIAAAFIQQPTGFGLP